MDPWWKDLFGGVWAEVRLGAGEDRAQAWREAAAVAKMLGLAPGARVLDVPSGPGRLTLPLAAVGLATYGLDLEPRMTAAAARLAAAAGLRAGLVVADMRRIPFGAGFDAVVCSQGSFGYFGDEDNALFLRQVAGVLRSGGRFLLAVQVVETLLPRFRSHSRTAIPGGMVVENATYDALASVVESSWQMVRPGQPITRSSSSIRLYRARELMALLGDSGFGQVDAFGSLAGAPFGPGAEQLVAVARMPTPRSQARLERAARPAEESVRPAGAACAREPEARR
jgi:SAM-dependent methyltransferase